MIMELSLILAYLNLLVTYLYVEQYKIRSHDLHAEATTAALDEEQEKRPFCPTIEQHVQALPATPRLIELCAAKQMHLLRLVSTTLPT